jgi:nicotinate-nucleotide pyrophosphorylase (carboxylating)
MDFTQAEFEACCHLIDLALGEDFGAAGDLTSQAIIPTELNGRAVFVARGGGVLAGRLAAAMASTRGRPGLMFTVLLPDGTALWRGARVATVAGPMRDILAVERTALNFLQRLSGIATLTRRYVEAVAGLRARIFDTRKTTPGWRLLEKYAVRCGGGCNHRIGLYDGILIKDNHLAALGGKIAEAIRAARAHAGDSIPLEIEVDSLDQLDIALTCVPDIILLDNMGPDLLREAVRRRDAVAPRVQLEASGGVNLETVRALAESGVDRISVGALTHSAPALDIGLDYETP